jgi:hypothetical protein
MSEELNGYRWASWALTALDQSVRQMPAHDRIPGTVSYT